jgi:hypothetical protein
VQLGWLFFFIIGLCINHPTLCKLWLVFRLFFSIRRRLFAFLEFLILEFFFELLNVRGGYWLMRIMFVENREVFHLFFLILLFSILVPLNILKLNFLFDDFIEFYFLSINGILFFVFQLDWSGVEFGKIY